MTTTTSPQPPTPAHGLTRGPAVLRNSPERLGMSIDQRLLLSSLSSFVCGFTLGASHAGRLAALRFRAENAHRLPLSQPGWYLYHKSKNYYKLNVGIREGMRKGAYLAAWAGVFFVIEESIDVFRGTWRAGRTLREMEGVDELDAGVLEGGVAQKRDFLSSGAAGMVVGGLWSAWNHFPMVTAARTIRMGLVVGVGYGLVQDAIMYVRGNHVPYVEKAESWIYKGSKNQLRKQAEEEARAAGLKAENEA